MVKIKRIYQAYKVNIFFNSHFLTVLYRSTILHDYSPENLKYEWTLKSKLKQCQLQYYLKLRLTCLRYSQTWSLMSAKRLTVFTKLRSFPTPLVTLFMHLVKNKTSLFVNSNMLSSMHAGLHQSQLHQYRMGVYISTFWGFSDHCFEEKLSKLRLEHLLS